MQTAPDFDEQKEAISRTFDYWLEQPLEVMVEIGIWKLKRDFCFYLIGKPVGEVKCNANQNLRGRSMQEMGWQVGTSW